MQLASYEKKISDAWRERALIEVEVFLVMGNVITKLPAVRWTDWLDALGIAEVIY
ncbi:MAG: hypothetical protein QOD80_458 [Verrucomicrobiota bacterium]|jgi:hypothetical protein